MKWSQESTLAVLQLFGHLCTWFEHLISTQIYWICLDKLRLLVNMISLSNAFCVQMHDTPIFISICCEFSVQITRCLNFLWETTSLCEESIFNLKMNVEWWNSKAPGISFEVLSQGWQGLTLLSVLKTSCALSSSCCFWLFSSTITQPAVHESNYHLAQMPCHTICRFQKDIAYALISVRWYLLNYLRLKHFCIPTDHLLSSQISFGSPRTILQSDLWFGQHEPDFVVVCQLQLYCSVHKNNDKLWNTYNIERVKSRFFAGQTCPRPELTVLKSPRLAVQSRGHCMKLWSISC